MKEFLAIISVIIIVLFLFWLVFSIAYEIPYGKWYIQEKTVKDSTFYLGQYSQINDSIRIVKIKDNDDKFFDEFKVQVKKDSIWVDTKVFTYGRDRSKFEIINYLHWRYNSISKENKEKFWN